MIKLFRIFFFIFSPDRKVEPRLQSHLSVIFFSLKFLRRPSQVAIFYNWNISFYSRASKLEDEYHTTYNLYTRRKLATCQFGEKKIKATRKKDNTDGIAIANADAISSTPTCHFLLFSPDVCANARNLSFRSREIGIHSQLFFTPPPSPNGILHKILRCLSSMVADSKALKINMLSNSERRC